MAERKRVLLERLEKYYKEDEDVTQASVFTGKELGVPMDVLRVLVGSYGAGLMDILGEFSFLPVEGDEVWFFTSVLTIMLDVPKESVPSLAIAIAKLNFYLPYGAFCLSGDGKMLTYKAATTIRSDRDDDKIYEDMELAAETSLLVPENYVFALEQIADGKLLMNYFVKMITA